jgi:membrane protein YqaA with SNARE-associated domain
MKIHMSVLSDARSMVTRPGSQVHWVRLVIAFIAFIGFSYGLVYLLRLIDWKQFPIYNFEVYAYISVFIISLIANMTIIAPVPFALVIMTTAATKFNPLIVAFCAAAGGSIGELSGYYAGRWGRKIAIPESFVAYQKVEHWVQKYGIWAIAVLAFQPIVPFDIGGFVAGVVQLPVHKFLPALFAGKFPKYILFIYVTLGLIQLIPLPAWIS